MTQQGFPNRSAPLIDQTSGYVSQPWLQFFLALFNRTGQAIGVNLTLEMPPEFHVNGSPVGSLSGGFSVSYVSEAANLVFAAPSTSPGTPKFRRLTASDVPNGVPAGGSTGQMLRKTSNTDFTDAWQDTPLPLSLYMPGTPISSQFTGSAVTDACVFPANFAGSAGPALTASTGTAVVKVNKIHAGASTQIGTVTYTTSSTPTFATTGGVSQSLVAGDIVQTVYPSSPDATLADIFLTLRATRS